MTSTIIQQGRFTSDGTAKTLNLRADVDWIEVFNTTVAANDTQTTAIGVQYYWQKGMAAGSAWEYKKSDAANAAQLSTIITSNGFTPAGSFVQGTPITGTTITKASPPVCTAAGHGFSNGDTVVFSNLTEMPQLAQIYFTIANVTANTFELKYMDTNTANFTAETSFEVSKITGFPEWRQAYGAILGITAGPTTTIQLADDSYGFEVDNVVRLIVPSVLGMSQINAQQAKVLSVDSANNTITVDIDSSTYSPFVFPAASAVPFTFGQVQSVGTVSSNSSIDATKNISTLSLTLGAGADAPAGQIGDVIYWRAGTAFSVTNE